MEFTLALRNVCFDLCSENFINFQKSLEHTFIKLKDFEELQQILIAIHNILPFRLHFEKVYQLLEKEIINMIHLNPEYKLKFKNVCFIFLIKSIFYNFLWILNLLKIQIRKKRQKYNQRLQIPWKELKLQKISYFL